MDTFRVHTPGPYTTVQDRGRFGYRHMGVPLSGSLDPLAHTAANLLVGNGSDCAVLEITFFGPELEVLDTADIAVTGAAMELTLNGIPVPQWQTLRVHRGDSLRFGLALKGCRSYLAVTGGFDVPPVMGSRSTFVSGRIGGVEGRPLAQGDVLARGTGSPLKAPRRLPFPPHYEPEVQLRAVPGPQDRYFSSNLERFYSTQYRVTDKSNRMGCRLEGAALHRDAGAPQSIISEPTFHGNVQVPADGQPIILMVEQTIGGYAMIATVITADLFKAAQARPGDPVRFSRVTLEEAHELYREWNDYLLAMPGMLEIVES